MLRTRREIRGIFSPLFRDPLAISLYVLMLLSLISQNVCMNSAPHLPRDWFRTDGVHTNGAAAKVTS